MPLERREVELAFDAELARHWCGGKPFKTHLLNAYTILIPDGEKFIIRTCRKYSERLSDAVAVDVRGLYYQEGQHSIQHGRALDVYRRQGYRVEGMRRAIDVFCYGFLERIFPSVFALSTASAIEHINASIAEHFLSQDPFLGGSRSVMAQMFAWHFSEEIEHKSVVFDALNEIHNGRMLRFVGLSMSLVNFVGLLYLGAFVLAWQDRSLFTREYWRDFAEFNVSNQFLARLWRCSRQYMRATFHPRDVPNELLVQKGMMLFQSIQGIKQC